LLLESLEWRENEPGRIAYSDKSEEKKDNKQNKILKIINFFPGIRYNDLIRATSLKNGTLSHHLTVLEKNSNIKVIRTKNSNITRYYPASTPSEETIILGFLKIKTTREIILILEEKKYCTFNEIVSFINRAPSTASWNIKRLIDSEVIVRKKGTTTSISEYSLKN
jgi:predicted transcriptional regulator